MLFFVELIDQILKSISANITKDVLIGAYFSYFYHPKNKQPSILINEDEDLPFRHPITQVIIDIEGNFWVCEGIYEKGKLPYAQNFVLNDQFKQDFLKVYPLKLEQLFYDQGIIKHLKLFRLVKNTQMGNDKHNLLQIRPMV